MISLSRDGRQTLFCMLCPNNSCEQFLIRARPTGPLKFFFLEWQKSNSSRSQIELEVAKMAVVSQIANGIWYDSPSVYFPFSKSSFPSNIVFKGSKYSPSISWFVSKTTKSYQGTAKTRLYHVHVATSLHCKSSEFLLQLLIYFARLRNLSNKFLFF